MNLDPSRRLLVLCSGTPMRRCRLLERLYTMGFPITLVCDAEPTFELSFIEDFVVADFSRPLEAAEAVRSAMQRRPCRGALGLLDDEESLEALVWFLVEEHLGGVDYRVEWFDGGRVGQG